MILAPISADLPVQKDGRPVYTVEYRDLDTGKLLRSESRHERDAVRVLGAAELYVNLEPVAVGRNVNLSAYRH